MSTMEIVLIIIGAAVLAAGYFLPSGRKKVDEEVQLISEDEIRKLIDKETAEVHDRVVQTVDDGIKYAMENTERSMEKASNEKIMAINEYADTVLEEINKNHQEVVFLYDMLNDKHDNLINTISEMTAKAEKITQTVKDAEITAHEASQEVESAREAAGEMTGQVTEQIDQKLREAELTLEHLQEAGQAIRDAQNNLELTIGRVQGVKTETEKLQMMLNTLENQRQEQQREESQRQEQQREELQRQEQKQEEKKAEAEVITEQKAEEEKTEEVFRPISAKRVEIIREPEGDFSTPIEEKPQAKRGRRKSVKAEAEETMPKQTAFSQPEAAGVDLQFAQGREGGRNSNERILELHKAGKSNMAIAKELGLGLGEVKLVIDLFEGI